jgi:hypothetical protein
MSTVGVTRKLYIDSRYKVSGTDSDFLIELPVDVDCTRTSSFFVASCSFANTYQTITDKNNTLYVITRHCWGERKRVHRNRSRRAPILQTS